MKEKIEEAKLKVIIILRNYTFESIEKETQLLHVRII